VVDLGEYIFDKLRWLSLFHPIRNIFPSIEKSYGFVEIWVLFNLSCSIVFLFISSSKNILWWEIILLSFAVLRIFEIFIYQINVLLFDQYRLGEKYELRGVERIIILLLINYIEILFWFALLYRNFHFAFRSKYTILNSFWGSLYFSLVTMSTLGYGDITPITHFGEILNIVQTLLGLFMALLIIARFNSLLPTPKKFKNKKS